MICPAGARSTSLLQAIGGYGTVYSARGANLIRFSQKQQNRISILAEMF